MKTETVRIHSKTAWIPRTQIQFCMKIPQNSLLSVQLLTNRIFMQRIAKENGRNSGTPVLISKYKLVVMEKFDVKKLDPLLMTPLEIVYELKKLTCLHLQGSCTQVNFMLTTAEILCGYSFSDVINKAKSTSHVFGYIIQVIKEFSQNQPSFVSKRHKFHSLNSVIKCD
ncbi:hypothetical protein EGR_10400 [Echinococcus granulosus]|uniref:Uncharacterized protein n=1 Tax=Echinococcus granulosus TaxID=6210 RepID=W6U120_ECHGR|nr:hypothetical protein EGR_10400 [Echinococcus granulosus]EUB54738.1 hypothetical protein EGR_10400 [Echinococcus granulosus]